MADSLWTAFGEAARSQKTDRSALVRQFVAWYLHRGPLPERPPKRDT